MKSAFANAGIQTFISATILLATLGAGGPAHAGATQGRLSLDPHAALLGGGASFLDSGFDAPLRLPGGSPSSFSFGFTIPDDYEPSTPLNIVILWEGPSTGCDYALESNILFRARDGQPRDFNNATAGLQPVSASTGFTLLHDGFAIAMHAPATAHQTASVLFEITPTPIEFPTLQGGDAVNFGMFRPIGEHDSNGEPIDTCAGELGIAGVSIVYQQKQGKK
jgi:hypothetical protein